MVFVSTLLNNSYLADNPELTKEAADVFIWCLVQNPESYKQWVSLSGRILNLLILRMIDGL